MKIITFDTEFNSNKELLSAGIVFHDLKKINRLKEVFYKNKSDARTYKIHGLSTEFLEKHGVEKYKIKNLKEQIKEQDLIVCFNGSQDMKTVGLSYQKLISNKKIIDLDKVLSLLKCRFSLESISLSLNLEEEYRQKYPIHTSIMDAILTNKLFFKIINLLKEKYNDKEIVDLLTSITYAKFFDRKELFDDLIQKLNPLNDLVKSIKKIEPKKIKKINAVFLKNCVELFDEEMTMIAKYTHSDFKNFKKEYKKIYFKKEASSMGFKDLT